MSTTCLDCHAAIQGRSDKKFCDDSCRSNYNNKRKKQKSNLVKEINAILWKNREILAKLNPAGKTKVSGIELRRLGFDFSYFTNVYQTNAGKVYYFCYDQGYLQLDDHKYALVVRQNYVH